MRCPVCKAENGQGPQCRRCKADLSLLFKLEEKRGALLTAVKHALALGKWEEAIQQASEADWLRSDEEARQLLAVAYLLQRDFARAWECYQGASSLKRQGG
jgi:tetratricopeptide (TPR) repeat protein